MSRETHKGGFMSTNTLAIAAALLPEDDRRAHASGAASLLLGLLAAWGLSTIQFVIPNILFTQDTKPMVASVKISIPEKPKPVVKKPAQKVDVYHKKQGGGNSSKKIARGKPKAISGTSALAIINSRTQNMNLSAYQMMTTNMHRDVDKVLRSNARLITNGKTVIGERAGKASGDFLGDLGGEGTGIGDVIGGLIGTGNKSVTTKAKGPSYMPKASEIQMGNGSTGRSLQEVLQVVKSRTPGLRHIYNRYLRQQPGMEGKVTLRFTILPGGSIVRCDIASSTTGFTEFDEEVRKIVQTWNFKVIPAGEATITLPFHFSE